MQLTGVVIRSLIANRKSKKKKKEKSKKKRLLLPEDLLTTRFITLLQTVLKSFVLMVTGL